MIDDGVLLVFTREPIPGQTKTRLIPDLGAEGAAKLHTKLLYKTLYEASTSKFSAIQIWCSPDINHPIIKSYSEVFNITLHHQVGEDLGIRMFNAIDAALERFSFAVVVGSDCPMISTKIFDEAHDYLSNSFDAVLGPSEDGGYYLIGLNQSEYEIFRDINWGTESVADITRSSVKNLGWTCHETEQLWDVDTIQDVQRLKVLCPDFVGDIV